MHSVKSQLPVGAQVSKREEEKQMQKGFCGLRRRQRRTEKKEKPVLLQAWVDKPLSMADDEQAIASHEGSNYFTNSNTIITEKYNKDANIKGESSHSLSYRHEDLQHVDSQPIPFGAPKEPSMERFITFDEACRSSRKSFALNVPERGSLERDLILAKLNREKTLSLIRSWEDKMKALSVNRYNKKVAEISAWESARKAAAESRLRASEEKLEKKKATRMERVRNEIASIQMRAEEDRALTQAYHGEQILKTEEMAAKLRASGKTPRKVISCFCS